ELLLVLTRSIHSSVGRRMGSIPPTIKAGRLLIAWLPMPDRLRLECLLSFSCLGLLPLELTVLYDEEVKLATVHCELRPVRVVAVCVAVIVSLGGTSYCFMKVRHSSPLASRCFACAISESVGELKE